MCVCWLGLVTIFVCCTDNNIGDEGARDVTEIDAVLTRNQAKHKEIMHDTMQKISKELVFYFSLFQFAFFDFLFVFTQYSLCSEIETRFCPLQAHIRTSQSTKCGKRAVGP